MRLLHSESRDPAPAVGTRIIPLFAFLDLGTRLKRYLFQRPAHPSDGGLDDAQLLLRIVERDVLPRCVSSLGDVQAPAAKARAPAIGVEDRARFLQTVRYESAASTRRLVQALLERGVTHEAIFLDLLPNAARRLGELWDADSSDFPDATLGLCRLHQVLRELGVYEDIRVCPSVAAPRVMLASAPGDQHLLGVLIVAELFRREGWWVRGEPGASRRRLAALVAEDRFDVVGLSVARGDLADEVARTIRDIRAASSNSALKVVVGGRACVEAPDLLEALGADALVDDASAAPSAALELTGSQRPQARGGKQLRRLTA